MAEKTWRVEKIKSCEHVGHEVKIETEVVLPAENLPDQPPRILAHRCSSALECNGLEHPACGLAPNTTSRTGSPSGHGGVVFCAGHR